ncbi:MAG TPA: DUF1569 domain-containing protein [Cyclobacteriaceae bacterium]|nr:DUF1569 domain-containing protein [Cyclobacteriaceae bacterium]
MKNLFNGPDTVEILNRVEKLTPDAKREWGQMDVAQMVSHCGNALEMAMGIINPPRELIGRLIGGLFKSQYYNEKPFSPGSPTNAMIKVSGTRDFAKEKERLIKRIKEFSTAGEPGCTQHPHPFFGKLSPAEWSIGMYKHTDHHLRQFGS